MGSQGGERVAWGSQWLADLEWLVYGLLVYDLAVECEPRLEDVSPGVGFKLLRRHM
jgi:hypothetical protein